MKYKIIKKEEYNGEKIQYAGYDYYTLQITKDMPEPEVFFVEDDEEIEDDYVEA